MSLDFLLERKQEGIEYYKNDNGDIIMTITKCDAYDKVSYMLKDGIDRDDNNCIATYFIPYEEK